MDTQTEEFSDKVKYWRDNSTLVSAKIVGRNGDQAIFKSAEVYVRHWTQKEKALRTIKSFTVWLMIAIISVFIPILHFILVPIFLLACLIFTFSAYSKSSIVVGGLGTCPYCNKPFDVASADNRWPLSDVCSSCHRHVQIEKNS